MKLKELLTKDVNSMSEEEKKFLKQEGTKELKKILKEVYESSQEEEINGLNDDRRSEMSQIKYSLEELDVSDYLLFLNIPEENNVKIVIPSNNFEAAYIDFKDVKDKEFVQNCLDKLSPIIEGIKRYPLKSVKEILERKQHKDSEILGVISDRKVSDISKTVDEISTNIKEKTKENSSQTK